MDGWTDGCTKMQTVCGKKVSASNNRADERQLALMLKTLKNV